MEYQPLYLNLPTARPTAKKARPRKWKGHITVWTAVKAFFPDVRGLWQKHQRLLSFTELAWQWKSKSRPLHSLPFKKKVEYFYWVFKSGSHGPHLMSLLALHWLLPWRAHRACLSSLLQPRSYSKATSLRSKVTMVEFYTTVFLKNIPQFVIPKQNKIMHHSEKLVSHSEDV